MNRRAKLWRAGAVLFGIINIGGMGLALAMNEMMHAMAHVFLLFVGIGAYLLWKTVTTWASGQSSEQDSRASAAPLSTRHSPPQLMDQRVDHLQHSYDALALEVERIGEALRFRDQQNSGRNESTSVKKRHE
jgi:hypothetical protein